ncbi:MAG TPA: SGNH/GDSL hydrolase family protein, partial [Puia sp.]|nr:SGNH/GDSL hydrolase family protein [Puia sp.]
MKSWLALGDSYTIGESVPEGDRYAIQATRMLNDKGIPFEKPVFVAKTGWTTNDLLTTIKDRNLARYFDLVTLLIG